MKVFVTGVAGMPGASVMEILRREDCESVPTGRAIAGETTCLAFLKERLQ